MSLRGIRVGLALMLAPLPALVAYAEDPAEAVVRAAMGAVRQAAQGKADVAKKKTAHREAALKALVAGEKAGKAREAAEAAQKKAVESGEAADQEKAAAAAQDAAVAAQESTFQQERFVRADAALKEAQKAAADAKEAAGIALAAALQAVDAIKNKPQVKDRLQKVVSALLEAFKKL